MLFLVFELGNDRYALDVRQVAAVLPLVGVKRIPRAPQAVNGLFNYRGTPVPVLDLSQWTLGRPSARRLTTRMMLVHYPDETGRAPYLGPVVTDARGVLQWIDVRTLLPPSFRDMLFKQPMDGEWGLAP
jgi:chemotaxis-related protein WspB